jgi:hypothetical protein
MPPAQRTVEGLLPMTVTFVPAEHVEAIDQELLQAIGRALRSALALQFRMNEIAACATTLRPVASTLARRPVGGSIAAQRFAAEVAAARTFLETVDLRADVEVQTASQMVDRLQAALNPMSTE